ncbi:MAG: OmpH family outer membrane protein [Rhodospirillaceae bacterium]
MTSCKVRWAILVALVLAVAASGVARAEIKPPLIAVVDVQYVLHESTAGKGVQKVIDSKSEVFAKELAAQEDKLRQTEQDLGRQRGTLSEEAFAKKRRDFEKQLGDYNRDGQARRKSLEQGGNEAMQAIHRAMLEIIAALVQEQGVNIVLSKQQVVIVEKSMDLSQDVLERLNTKIPSVVVNLPPIKK